MSSFRDTLRLIKSKVLNVWLVPIYAANVRRYDAVLLQTPTYENIGDHAITRAEMEMLDKYGVSYYEFPMTTGIEKLCAKFTPERTVVFVNGGGFLGQLWTFEEDRFRRTVNAFKKQKIVVFPQTVFFDLKTKEGRDCFRASKAIYESHPDLTVFTREKQSFRIMKKNMSGIHVELVPDIVMSLEYHHKKKVRNGALVCLRNDHEKKQSAAERMKVMQALNRSFSKVTVTDTVLTHKIDLDHRNEVIDNLLDEFAASEMVITDRLHGMIFAAITETPCIVINSLSHKVKGCYEWLKELDYIRFMDDTEMLPDLIKELRMTSPRYRKETIETAMVPLTDLIKECNKRSYVK